MALIRYALASVLRNRRRTLSSILGLTLAVAFIAGTLIAIDSSARLALQSLLDANVSGDFTIVGPINDIADLESEIFTVDGVEAVVPSALVGPVEAAGPNWTSATIGTGRAIEPSNVPTFLEDSVLEGTANLPRGTMVASRSLASDLGLSLGDSVRLRAFLGDATGGQPPLGTPEFAGLNLTVEGILDLRAQDTGNDLFFIHLSDLGWIHEQLGLSFEPQVIVEVWIDRNRFVDPYDLDATREHLARLGSQLAEAARRYGGSISNNVLVTFESFETAMVGLRSIFLLFSVPVILLGLYLGAVGIDLSQVERQRELAVLNARGLGNRQVIGLLILEALLLGTLASLLGLLGGVALSRLLIGFVTPLPLGLAPLFSEIIITVDTAIYVALLGVLIMGFVTYSAAKRTAVSSPAQALAYQAPDRANTGYRPNLDIYLLLLGVAIYGFFLYSPYFGGGFLSFLAGPIPLALLPFAPTVIIVGATRLLTRSTSRTYELVSHASKVFARDLHYLVSRNLARNPRRSSSVALIMALGLAFGVFAVTLSASLQSQQEGIVRASVGADVAVTGPLEDTGFATNLSGLPEVAAVTHVAQLFASPPHPAAVYALDPDTYFAVTQPEPWYFNGMTSQQAARILGTRGEVLASKRYVESASLKIGDRLPIQGTVYNESGQSRLIQTNVTIGGVVRALPGTGLEGNLLGTELFGSSQTFGEFLEFGLILEPGPFFNGNLHLADLHTGADWRVAKSAMLAAGALRIRVYEEELARLVEDPFSRSVAGLVAVEVAFVVLILTLGLGLVMYAASIEREAEFGGIIARGSSGWQTAAVMVGEAFSISLVGLGLGLSIGLVTSFLTTLVFQPTSIVEGLVPFLFILPIDVYLLAGATFLAAIVASGIVALRVARMNIARGLRVRAG